MTPAIIVGNGMLQGSVVASEEWRKHGEVRRRALLERDEVEGGTSFDINSKCRIQRYFQVGDRVLAQFRSMYKSRSNLEEIYVMGYRLIAFYTQALPQHPHYRSIDPSISSLREKTLVDLDWIRKRLDVISLRIDEVQLNQYIISDVSATCEPRQDTDTGWESFSGWTGSDEERPTPIIATTQVATKESVVHTSLLSKLSKMEIPLEHADDPGDTIDLESDDDTSVENDVSSVSGGDSGDPAVAFEMVWSQNDYQTPDACNSSFLRAIAREEVTFESDSEAADSWAQNDSDDEELENILFKYDSDERENVNPDCSIQNFPSFDEPADTVKGNALTASPYDVMHFERHRANIQCSGEETLPIYVSRLHI